MTPQEILSAYLPEVEGFVKEVEHATDESERQADLQRISKMIRFLRDFYVEFMRDALELRVQGFSYKDKRKVSRRLIRAEDQAAEVSDDELDARLKLAARFEDFTDLLHGDLEFGYSDEDDDYEVFHRYAFPEWLEAVEAWLRIVESGGEELADSIRAACGRYQNVISSSY